MPSSMRFFYREEEEGVEIGPLTQSELVAAATDGTITPRTFIRNNINLEWVRAGRVKGLFNDTKEQVSGTSFFYLESPAEVGPLTQSELVAAATDGKITPLTAVRDDINDEWVRADLVKGLFDALHGGDAAESTQSATTIYVIAQDKIHGPYERAQIRQFAETGHINQNTILQIGQDGERKPAGEILPELVTKQAEPDATYVIAQSGAPETAAAGSSSTYGMGTPTKRCPFCEEQILADALKCLYCGEFLPQTSDGDSQNTKPRKKASPMPVEAASAKQYKVLTQKDKWFSGKFDPAKLEEALNAYAEQGWIVKAATTATIPGFGANRDELVVILER